MPAITEATAQARLIAKRGANAAAVLIGASFHPFRTVRGGASIVRGLVSPAESPVAPAPTDTPQQPAATPAAMEAKAAKAPEKETPATKPAAKKAPGKKAPAAKKAPGPTTVAKPVAPPQESAVDAAPQDTDRPVEPRGPVPHIPPSIAGEVERDYGDDLPGITPAGD